MMDKGDKMPLYLLINAIPIPSKSKIAFFFAHPPPLPPDSDVLISTCTSYQSVEWFYR